MAKRTSARRDPSRVHLQVSYYLDRPMAERMERRACAEGLSMAEVVECALRALDNRLGPLGPTLSLLRPEGAPVNPPPVTPVRADGIIGEFRA